MGSLMSELGCGSDWYETCAKTDLLPVPGSPTLFAGTFTVPAGDPAEPFDYLYKVRLNGAWTENYGDATFGLPDGNIPLAIDKTTTLRFTYDHATHRVRVGPAEPAGGLTAADRAHGRRQPAQGPHPRELLLRDGRPLRERHEGQRHRRHRRRPRLQNGFDPTNQGFYHGGDLKGIINRLDYIQGLGTTAIWMTPSFKNKPVQGAAGLGVGRLPRLLDHRLHPDRPPPRHQRRAEDPHRPRPQARHQGLLRHHHQPHRRRARLPGLGLRRHRSGAVQDQGRPRRTRTPRASRSTTATSPSSVTRSRRSTRRSASPTSRRSSTPADATRQGPRLAQRPDDVPQPRHVDLLRREQRVRRLPVGEPLRARRPVDRAAPGRAGDDRHLQDLGGQAGVDGFRIDTVKHVNMDFWKQFGPALQGHAASVGNKDFFMFGEVYDADPRFMSRVHDRGTAAGDRRLRLPGQRCQLRQGQADD